MNKTRRDSRANAAGNETALDERYHVLTLRDGQDGVSWNGHYWPRSYCTEVIEETRDRLTHKQVHLSCGHWTSAIDRFCPHCGRAVVVMVHD